MNKFTVTVNGEDGTPKYFKFPDGQPHVEFSENQIKGLTGLTKDLTIRGSLKSSDDIITLILLVEVISDLVNMSCFVTFECTYLLGARMDRTINAGQPFTLKIIANLINGLNFGQVKILEPHSDVSLDLIHNSEKWSRTLQAVKRIHLLLMVRGCNFDVIVCPDNGAKKLITEMSLPENSTAVSNSFSPSSMRVWMSSSSSAELKIATSSIRPSKKNPFQLSRPIVTLASVETTSSVISTVLFSIPSK